MCSYKWSGYDSHKHQQHTKLLLFLLLLVIVVLVIVFYQHGHNKCPPSNPEVAYVLRVIDGDTIVVRLDDGSVERVRYLGIDTPEFGEPYSRIATNANKDFVLNKYITMHKDTKNKDKYNRLLRYVFVDDVFVNFELVERGLAKVLFIGDRYACRNVLVSAQLDARGQELALWR
jgi:micrococcal nuclease